MGTQIYSLCQVAVTDGGADGVMEGGGRVSAVSCRGSVGLIYFWDVDVCNESGVGLCILPSFFSPHREGARVAFSRGAMVPFVFSVSVSATKECVARIAHVQGQSSSTGLTRSRVD